MFHFNYLMAQGQIAIAKARWKIITLTNQGLVPILWIIPHHYILVWQRRQHAHSVLTGFYQGQDTSISAALRAAQ